MTNRRDHEHRSVLRTVHLRDVAMRAAVVAYLTALLVAVALIVEVAR